MPVPWKQHIVSDPYVAKRFGDAEVAAVRRALQVKELPESWKEYFRERLRQAGTDLTEERRER